MPWLLHYLALKPQDSIPVPLPSGHSLLFPRLPGYILLVPLLPDHNLLILYYIFEHKLRCNKEYQIVNNQQLDLIDSSKQVAG